VWQKIAARKIIFALYNIPSGRQKQFRSRAREEERERETFSNAQTCRRRFAFPSFKCLAYTHTRAHPRATHRHEQYGFAALPRLRQCARVSLINLSHSTRLAFAAADRCLTFAHRHGRDRICTIFSSPSKRLRPQERPTRKRSYAIRWLACIGEVMCAPSDFYVGRDKEEIDLFRRVAAFPAFPLEFPLSFISH